MPIRDMILQTNVLAAFLPEKFVQKRIADTDAFDVRLICLDTGQIFPVHTPDADAVYILWEGRADLIIGEKETQIATGHIVTVPRGMRRGFRARAKTIVFMMHSPPLPESLWKELETRQATGEFP